MIGVLAAERDEFLRQRDEALGERNEYLRQRDEALGERNEYLRQRDEALGERNEYLRQRDEALGERNEYLRQRDEALGERNEYLRQHDEALGERDEYLRQHDEALGERNEYLRQRDEALGERNEYLRQRDEALGERNEYLRQRDEALGERNEYLRQRDEALGERNEYLRQRDEALGERNRLADRSARYLHRADVIMHPAAATGDRLLLFLHIAKTGGMTLADIFTRNLATEEYLQIDLAETDASATGIWSTATIERALARLPASGVAKLRAVWGHYRHGIQDHLPKPCATMTLLREPVDRLISAAFYTDLLAEKSLEALEDYLDRKHHHVGVDNAMTRLLSGRTALDPVAPEPDATTENFPRVGEADLEAAAGNLESYLLVGTTDQFDETLIVLAGDLRWSLSDLVFERVNVTPSRPSADDISDALREQILSRSRYDAALFERARAHLRRRVAGYRGDFGRDLSLFRELNALYRRGAPTEELRRIEREALRGFSS